MNDCEVWGNHTSFFLCVEQGTNLAGESSVTGFGILISDDIIEASLLFL